jgi:hypothetical protein
MVWEPRQPLDRHYGSPFSPHPRHRSRSLRLSTFEITADLTRTIMSAQHNVTPWRRDSQQAPTRNTKIMHPAENVTSLRGTPF